MIVEKKEVLRKMVNRMGFFDKEIRFLMPVREDEDEWYEQDYSKEKDDNLKEEEDKGVIIAKGETVASTIEDILNTFDTKEELYKTLNATKEILTDIVSDMNKKSEISEGMCWYYDDDEYYLVENGKICVKKRQK